MRAHQVMTRKVLTIGPEKSVVDAANLMLQNHISGLPVVSDGKLVGIISESDLLRRVEIGTQTKRSRWSAFFTGPGKNATDFVREQGRKVSEVMTPDPITINEETPLEDIVRLMETRGIKRLPVVEDDRVVGIVTRANLLQAVASLARDVPDPTADDQHIRDRVLKAIENNDWAPLGLGVTVRNGVVHINGIVTDYRSREAAIVAAENVAGVKKVHDHLAWVDPVSGMFLDAPDETPPPKS